MGGKSRYLLYAAIAGLIGCSSTKPNDIFDNPDSNKPVSEWEDRSEDIGEMVDDLVPDHVNSNVAKVWVNYSVSCLYHLEESIKGYEELMASAGKKGSEDEARMYKFERQLTRDDILQDIKRYAFSRRRLRNTLAVRLGYTSKELESNFDSMRRIAVKTDERYSSLIDRLAKADPELVEEIGPKKKDKK